MQTIFIYIDIPRILVTVHEFAFDINIHLVKNIMHLIFQNLKKVTILPLFTIL